MERPMAQNLGDSLTLGLLAIDGMYRGPNNNTGFGLIPVHTNFLQRCNAFTETS